MTKSATLTLVSCNYAYYLALMTALLNFLWYDLVEQRYMNLKSDED